MISKAVGFLRYLIQRERNYRELRPTNVLIFLTYRCTSHCNSCSMWKRKIEGPELTLEQWKAFIDTISGKGIRHMEMFGGDALMRKDVLLPLIRYAREKCGCTVDLTTNCNLLDRKTAEELVATGIDVISVSVDGVEGLHDRVRNTAGTFARVRNALSYLREAKGRSKKPRLLISCTVSALNIEGFEKVRDFGEEAGVDAVAFEYAGQFSAGCLRASAVDGVEPRPFYADPDNRILVDRAQAKILKKKIARIKRIYAGTVPAPYTKNIDALTVDDLVRGTAPNKRCYVSRYLIGVDPYGNVLPCAFFPDYRIGNILKEDFDSIWNNERHKKFLDAVSGCRLPICRHCVIGVERNPTPAQLLYRKARALAVKAAGTARKAAVFAARMVFLTNSAWWYDRDIRPELPVLEPRVAVEPCFDNETTITWLREHGHGWMCNEKEIAVARKERHFFACVKSGPVVVGYVKAATGKVYIHDYRKIVSLKPRQAFFYDVYTSPAYRGKDIAPYITLEVMRRLREAGFESASLHIPEWNKASMSAAEKNGFRKVAYVRYMRIMGIPFFLRRSAKEKA